MSRLADDRVLVRHVGRGTAADLAGAAAIVWLAAEAPTTAGELVAELGIPRSSVDEAIEMLSAAGWMES